MLYNKSFHKTFESLFLTSSALTKFTRSAYAQLIFFKAFVYRHHHYFLNKPESSFSIQFTIQQSKRTKTTNPTCTLHVATKKQYPHNSEAPRRNTFASI